jgi:HEAT repeat protein
MVDGMVLGLLASAWGRAQGEARACLSALDERVGYTEGLRRATWSVFAWRRARAAHWLGRLGRREAVSDLIRLIEDPFREVRCAAVTALGSIRDPRALSALLKVVDRVADGPFHRWRPFARRAATAGRCVPIGVLTGALVAQGPWAIFSLLPRLQTGPTAVREAIADVLGASPDPHPRVRAALLGALRDRDAEVRARAAKALGAIGDAGSTVPLTDALLDAVWFVRLQAARALGRLSHSGAIRALVGALTDESWQVRAAAADALRRLGPPAVTALATCLMTSHDRYAKEQIVEELQRTSMVRERIAALDDARPEVGFAAQQLLREVVRHGATRIVLDALRRHPRPAVRRRLVEVLAGLETPPVIAALREAMNGERDPDVRAAVGRVLSHVGGRAATRDVAEGQAA